MLDHDIILRVLFDNALEGKRSYSSAKELAWHSDTGEKNTYKTLSHPIRIGAVNRHPHGGFSVVDPERVLMLLASRRRISGRRLQLNAVRNLLASAPSYAIGGTRAAAHYLTNGIAIADHAETIVYLPDQIYAEVSSLAVKSEANETDTAIVMVARDQDFYNWPSGYTSPGQTYADLFAQPGWQSSEFRRALWRKWFDADDWEQKGLEIASISG